MAVQDDKGRTWGWENQTLCVYKDEHQTPLPADRSFPDTTWEDVAACPTYRPTANTSAPDTVGRLWGWDSQKNRYAFVACFLPMSPLHPCRSMPWQRLKELHTLSNHLS